LTPHEELKKEKISIECKGTMSKKLSLNPKDRRAIENFRHQVVRLLGDNLLQIALFGSKATGQDTQDSDIDILILVKHLEVNLKNQILDIAFDINLKHEVYISPRMIAFSTFNDPVWSKTPFIRGLRALSLPL